MTEFEILNYKVSRLELYLAISGDRDSAVWYGYQELADMRDFQWSLMEQECPEATPEMVFDEIFGPCACGECDDSWFEEEGWAS